MKKVRAVFLDRDGVINRYPGHGNYVTSLAGFELLPGVKDALARLAQAGFCLFVVSNQAGVARGLYSQQDLDDMDRCMQAQLAPAHLDGIYYCTHLPEDKCDCRKPKTAFLDRAAAHLAGEGLELDAAGSFFIGDSLVDVEAGKAAGLSTILVFTGKEKASNSAQWTVRPDRTAEDLSAAASLVLAI
jgi:histidinol-phosphate phosphatase family protein